MSANGAVANNSLEREIHPTGMVLGNLPFTTKEVRTHIPTDAKLLELCHTAAAEMHRNWCLEFEKEKGIGTQRNKQIKADGTDPRVQELLAKGVVEFNINCPYEDLLNQFKEFNLTSAIFVCALMNAVQREALACSPQVFYELVHQDWLDRSPYAHSGPLDVAWCWLSKVEQDKDVAVYDICVKHLRETVDEYCTNVLFLA